MAMVLDHGRHVMMLQREDKEFKIDAVLLGGLVKTYNVDFNLFERGNEVYIVFKCDELLWNLMVNEVKKWSELKSKVRLAQKKRRKGAK